MTRAGRAWVGDQVRDERAEREGITTDVKGGTYLLRPPHGMAAEWTADSDEYPTVTVPRDQRADLSPESRSPGHPVTASVLLTDPEERVLLVHPAGRSEAQWALPGGLVEAGESPLDAARREVSEELGIEVDIRTQDLFAVEWLEATRPGRRDRLAFVFAGPYLSLADTDAITLQRYEVDRWTWATPPEALEILHPRIAARIRGPLQLPGSTLYLETRNERTPAT